MSNNIIIAQAMPHKIPEVEQTGKSNVNVTNNEGGIVNFNYNFPQNGVINSAEKMIAIQNLSEEYYQLIVTLDEDVFRDNVVSVVTTRALTKNGVLPEIYERCSDLSESGQEGLKRFPALICMENTEMNGNTDPRQMGIYAFIAYILHI